MNFIEQLCCLKQIYQNENSYYDSEKNNLLYRIPTSIPVNQLESLKQAGHMPNQMSHPEHDEIWDAFYTLADNWTLSEAAHAFIAGLWSAPFLWQSALNAKLLSLATPRHTFTPYKGSVNTCIICGFHKKAVDSTLAWYNCMTGGVPLDGDPVKYVFALREMEKLGQKPTPTAYDLWTFRAILTVIRSLPPKSRYSKLRDSLYKEKLLPASQKGNICSFLEGLALAGILDTPDHPGMPTRFTTYQERDIRPSVRVEPQSPLAWWDSSFGINETTLKKIFGEIDCSCVSLADRPTPSIPLSQTVTGSLQKQKMPCKRLPKSPDAGKGPIQAGDVYAIRIREDVWVTAYCHKTEEKYAVMEYLDGIFSEMPKKSHIISAYRPRKNGRWQAKTSSMDRTTGIKRIARNIPAPQSELAKPDSIPFATANNLKHLAHHCFHELP